MSRTKRRRIPLGRMSDEDIRSLAGGIPRLILSRTEGPLEDPITWVAVARSLGARVFGYRSTRNQEQGFYDGSTETVYYNLWAPQEERVRYLIHETVHHALVVWPGSRFPRRALERYDDDRQSVQHRTARAVEEIIMETITERLMRDEQ